VEIFRKILYPFSWIYDFVTLIRNYLYDKNLIESTSFKTATIVVGNLNIGGTGKTPQIEYLIDLLRSQYKLAVLSRGYKRKSKGFLIAKEGCDVQMIGDEPFQLYKKFPEIRVVVSEDRAVGIRQLEKLKDPPNVILLDDAFQHRRVKGTYNILLTAHSDLYVEDVVLPAGNLRERSSGAKRAQLIIVTKCPQNLSEQERKLIVKKLELQGRQSVFFTSIKFDVNLLGSEKMTLEKLANQKILLVTGIANPDPLVTFLKGKGLQIEHLKYSDHYNFKESDILKIKARREALDASILTTEKDYVRLMNRLEHVYYIPIKVDFLDQKNEFDQLIQNFIRQSVQS
jgi:tetraacyldisaccharide 4'-kinase